MEISIIYLRLIKFRLKNILKKTWKLALFTLD
jgi:hypothetical protein